MLHNAILTGDPIPEFRDYASSDSENIRINLPTRPQEHREMFRDWYLQNYR
jgi:hypothetical protein